MKLNKTQRQIERSDAFKESKFKIAANAHAFEILSSRLYTDTTLAIVRELSTNAADSHVEAGNADMPFDVHLPNHMEPHFSIRDYGTGLSPEQVEQIYTTYFESTRNDSNDFTGALGLGSKSPFAYTDSFTVVSYFNGTAYTYTAFKAETGEPSIALMTEAATDEANGLEIRIDTKPGDEYTFRDKAEKVYRFFKVRPNITGARVDIPDPEPAMSDDGWELYKGNAAAAGKISVVMGNVCYAASRGKITHKLGYSGQLVLHVPIGTCSIAANREELQYDEETIQNLQRLIDKAEKKARKLIEDSIGNCPTLLDKLIAFKQYHDLLDFPIRDKTVPTQKTGAYLLRKLEIKNDKLYVGYDRFNSELRPGAETRYCFVECDVDELKQKHKNALRYWISQRQIADRRAGIRSEVFYLASIESPTVFEDTFGATTIKLSDIPAAPRNHGGGGGGGTRTFIKELNDSWTRRISDCWESIDADEVDTTNAIAVVRKGYKVMWNGHEADPNGIRDIARSLGFTHIYGLPQNRYDKLRDELGLEDLEDQARIKMEDFVKTADRFDRAVWHHRTYHDFTDEWLLAIQGLSTECSDMVKMVNTPSKPYCWDRLLNQFGLKMPDGVNYLEVFQRKYPLIANLNLSYTKLSDVTEYINLKEKN